MLLQLQLIISTIMKKKKFVKFCIDYSYLIVCTLVLAVWSINNGEKQSDAVKIKQSDTVLNVILGFCLDRQTAIVAHMYGTHMCECDPYDIFIYIY